MIRSKYIDIGTNDPTPYLHLSLPPLTRTFHFQLKFSTATFSLTSPSSMTQHHCHLSRTTVVPHPAKTLHPHCTEGLGWVAKCPAYRGSDRDAQLKSIPRSRYQCSSGRACIATCNWHACIASCNWHACIATCNWHACIAMCNWHACIAT